MHADGLGVAFLGVLFACSYLIKFLCCFLPPSTDHISCIHESLLLGGNLGIFTCVK